MDSIAYIEAAETLEPDAPAGNRTDTVSAEETHQLSALGGRLTEILSEDHKLRFTPFGTLRCEPCRLAFFTRPNLPSATTQPKGVIMTTTTTTVIEQVLEVIRSAVLSVVSAESWDARGVETIHLAATGCSDARLVDDENWEQLEAHVEDAMGAALTAAGYPAVDTAFISHYVARPRKHDEECGVEGCVICRALMSGPVLVNSLNFPEQRCSFAELMDAARKTLSEAEVKGLLNQTAANATMVTALLADAVSARSAAEAQPTGPLDDF